MVSSCLTEPVMQSSVPPSNTLNRNASAARSAESSSVKLRSVGRKAWRGVRVCVCVCVYVCVCVCVRVCVDGTGTLWLVWWYAAPSTSKRQTQRS
jgi:hypothetical protein